MFFFCPNYQFSSLTSLSLTYLKSILILFRYFRPTTRCKPLFIFFRTPLSSARSWKKRTRISGISRTVTFMIYRHSLAARNKRQNDYVDGSFKHTEKTCTRTSIKRFTRRRRK